MTETDDVVRRLLGATTTWAVVGLRDNPVRAAHGVARFLQKRGKRIVPVHHQPQDVHGEPAYPRLADIPFPVDVVDVFVNSALAGGIADQAVAIGAKAVWFQLDVIDEDAYDRVTAAGLDMVMDRCPVIEWPRLGPVGLARSGSETHPATALAAQRLALGPGLVPEPDLELRHPRP